MSANCDVENVVVEVPRLDDVNWGEDIICIGNRHASDDDHVNTINDNKTKEHLIMIGSFAVVFLCRSYSMRIPWMAAWKIVVTCRPTTVLADYCCSSLLLFKFKKSRDPRWPHGGLGLRIKTAQMDNRTVGQVDSLPPFCSFPISTKAHDTYIMIFVQFDVHFHHNSVVPWLVCCFYWPWPLFLLKHCFRGLQLSYALDQCKVPQKYFCQHQTSRR